MSEIVLAIIGGGVGAAIVSGIFSIVLWRMQRNAQKNDELSEIKTAMCALFYRNIKQDCKKYIESGTITAEELEDLIKEHKIYHETLDGNGFLDSLMQQCKHLPVHQ